MDDGVSQAATRKDSKKQNKDATTRKHSIAIMRSIRKLLEFCKTIECNVTSILVVLVSRPHKIEQESLVR